LASRVSAYGNGKPGLRSPSSASYSLARGARLVAGALALAVADGAP